MKQATRYSNRPVSDDPRDTEAWALTEAARRLIDASRDPENTAALQAALQLNQRLWTIFQAAITEPDCALAKPLRANLAALSLLVDRETMARLADLDVSKLDKLIQINRSVAAGLSQRPGAAATPAAKGAAAPAAKGAPAKSQTAAPAEKSGRSEKPAEPLRISI